MNETAWIPVESAIWPVEGSEDIFSQFIAGLQKISEDFGSAEWSDEIERFRRYYLRKAVGTGKDNRVAGTATLNLLSDLARQGWRFRYEGRLLMKAPDTTGREARKAQLLAQRTEQLRSAPVQSFIRKMERTKWFQGKRVSIFSLMRDGRDLASALEKVVRNGASVGSAIRPYLQFVYTQELCGHTGLVLTDIWRYFRYTWSSPYQTVPGRMMMFLVRDASAPFHPVMGLGALSSAAVKLRGRDEFLGWESDSVQASLLADPSRKAALWLESVLGDRLSEIYKADLVEDGILPLNLEEPTEDLIRRLEEEADEQREKHHGNMNSQEYKKGFDETDVDEVGREVSWEAQARTPLFRSKRAAELSILLLARRTLQNHTKNSTLDLGSLLRDKQGQQIVGNLVKLAKSTRVGTAIADLTICGALPPYNPLLVGKLVALLAVSPEVIRESRRRYGKTPSVIASSMAGRAIVRPSDLVFVGTTSLYGERPCQYDSISIPAEHLGGMRGKNIKYRFIDDTVGWGTFQFSDATTKAIMSYVKSENNGQRVNYVFGEGANPKMRALREGLAALGFNEEKLLRHGHRRSMYGVVLVSNLTEYLLGQDSKPKYLFGLKSAEVSTQSIVDWWAQRWLSKRLVKPETFEEVRKHTLIHPIEHGARVRLPASDLEQFSLLP